jgi:hypothetical protein
MDRRTLTIFGGVAVALVAIFLLFGLDNKTPERADTGAIGATTSAPSTGGGTSGAVGQAKPTPAGSDTGRSGPTGTAPASAGSAPTR